MVLQGLAPPTYAALSALWWRARRGLCGACCVSGAGGAGGAGAKATPAELKKDIAQLEDERGQLIERIASLKKKTAEIRGFAPLLDRSIR
jgi:hypothetical protein